MSAPPRTAERNGTHPPHEALRPPRGCNARRRRGAGPLVRCGRQSQSQSCPAPLADARRLVLVTAETMNEPAAEMQLYERASAGEPWRALGAVRAGDARPRRHRLVAFLPPLRARGRADQGRGRQARARGLLPDRPELRHRAVVAAPPYPGDRRHGLRLRAVVAALQPHRVAQGRRSRCQRREHEPDAADVPPRPVVDYPTDGRSQAGSCIFIHVWKTPTTGTAGCVAMPEPRVEALQDFSAGGAVLAILPQQALGRFATCLPKPGQPANRPPRAEVQLSVRLA